MTAKLSTIPGRSRDLTLTVDGLGVARGGHWLIEHLDLEIKPGAALLIRGPNGSGKSTLLRVLAGLMPAGVGSITLDLADGAVQSAIDAERYRCHVHIITTADGLKPALTVAEQIACSIALAGGSDDPKQVTAAAGLTDLSARPIATLSTGQKRRVALARLRAPWRPVWLLDEPETGLDADGRDLVRAMIADHRQAGGIVVMASHRDLGIEQAWQLDLGGDL